MQAFCGSDRGFDAAFIGHINLLERTADSLGLGLPQFLVHIKDRDLRTRIAQLVHCRAAQSRRAAGYNGCLPLDFHVYPS